MVNPIRPRFNPEFVSAGMSVRLAAEETLKVTDACTQLRIERIEGLTRETKTLSDEDQKRIKELLATMGRIENVKRFETSVNMIGSGVLATGGVIAGSPLMAGIAVFNGFHQFLSRTQGYHHFAGAFTNDPEKQAELGKAIQNYIGYLSITGTFAGLFIGGSALVEKGLEGTSEMVNGTTTLHTLSQAGTSITHAHLEQEKLKRQGEGYLINDELFKIGQEREEVNGAIRDGLSTQSSALSQAAKTFEKDVETQKQIIKKGS